MGVVTKLLDITLTRGDDNDMALTTGVDLSGGSVRFTARYAVGDATAVFTKTTSSGIDVTDAAGGLATVHILAVDWTAYSGSHDLVYDVEVANAAGKVSTVLKGTLHVLQDVSR